MSSNLQLKQRQFTNDLAQIAEIPGTTIPTALTKAREGLAHLNQRRNDKDQQLEALAEAVATGNTEVIDQALTATSAADMIARDANAHSRVWKLALDAMYAAYGTVAADNYEAIRTVLNEAIRTLNGLAKQGAIGADPATLMQAPAKVRQAWEDAATSIATIEKVAQAAIAAAHLAGADLGRDNRPRPTLRDMTMSLLFAGSLEDANIREVWELWDTSADKRGGSIGALADAGLLPEIPELDDLDIQPRPQPMVTVQVPHPRERGLYAKYQLDPHKPKLSQSELTAAAWDLTPTQPVTA